MRSKSEKFFVAPGPGPQSRAANDPSDFTITEMAPRRLLVESATPPHDIEASHAGSRSDDYFF